MRILLDECLPRRLGKFLFGHDVKTVPQMGWAGQSNGELLQSISDEFDVLITIDGSLTFQQNLLNRPFALIVLSAPTNQIDDLEPLAPLILEALRTIKPGEIIKLPGRKDK